MAKTLHYDFKANPSLSAVTGPTLNITRATSATMVDADGYIREVQSGEARFDGAAFAHNLWDTSRSSDQPFAFTGDATITDDDVTDPFGVANNAQTMEITSTSNPRVFVAQIEVGIGSRVAASFYQKAGTGVTTTDTLFDGLGTVEYTLTGDGSYNISVAGTIESAGIESVGDGWYRTWVIGESSAASARVFGRVIAAEEQVGNKLHLFGIQIEKITPAQTAPSSYIVADNNAAVTSLSGSNNGLLVEDARTNIALQSEDFSTSWTAGAETGAIGTNATTAPDGSTTADRLIDDNGGGTGNDVEVTQTLSTPSDGNYTTSVFAKADGANAVRLSQLAVGALDVYVGVDLSDGSIINTGSDNVNEGVEDYGNGWYRIWVTWDSTGDAGSTIAINVTTDAGSVVVDRDGTSSIYIWGAQLEQAGNEQKPTSYIPTTTASVTRNKDLVNSTELSSALNDSEGTYYVHATYPGDVPTGTRALYYIDPSDAHRIQILGTGTVRYRPNLTSGTAILGVGSLTEGTDFRSVVAYATDDFEHYVDGARSGTGDQDGTPRTGSNSIVVGSNGSGEFWNGLIKEIRYYDERLDNATLEDLSNGIFPVSIVENARFPRDAMPTPTQRFFDFIDNAGGAQTGSLQADYRRALIAALGLDDNDQRSIDCLFKELYERENS